MLPTKSIVLPSQPASGYPQEEAPWKASERPRLADQLLGPMPEFLPEDYVSLDSYKARRERQRALLCWAMMQNFDLMVTIRLSDCCTGHQIREWLKNFDALLDRHLLGHNYYLLPSAARTLFIASVEQDRANYGVHVHMLLRLPPTLPLTWKLCPLLEIKARLLGVYDIDARTIKKHGSDAIAARILPQGSVEGRQPERVRSSARRVIVLLLRVPHSEAEGACARCGAVVV